MYSLAAFAAFAFSLGIHSDTLLVRRTFLLQLSEESPIHAAARQACAARRLILQMGSGSVTGVFLR
ncbi:MAG: hypothetical protein DMF98_02865 [Acidobacteria bacterium]|nr:MAG: hypothetical protein DMF98_02865 [Acidobacteriota bacterium]